MPPRKQKHDPQYIPSDGTEQESQDSAAQESQESRVSERSDPEYALLVPASDTEHETDWSSDADEDGGKDENAVRSILDKRINPMSTVQWLVEWAHRDPETKTKFPHQWLEENQLQSVKDHVAAFEETDPDSQPQSNPPAPTGLREHSQYADLLETGYNTIINQFIELEGDQHKFLRKDGDMARELCMGILSSMDRKVLGAILSGNLARSKYVDPDVRNALNMNWTEVSMYENKHPCIYLHEFVDQKEAKEIIEFGLKYIDDYKYAWEINEEVDNNLVPDYRDNDFRKYLKNDVAKAAAKACFRASLEYLNRHDPDERMWQPWRECGYTQAAKVRKDDHQYGRSTNYLMQLLTAISKKEFGSKYRHRFEVVFPCFQNDHAKYGKVLITAISGSKTEDGHGLSHHPAGKSVSSYNKFPDWVIDIWTMEAFEKWPIRSNIAIEVQICEEAVKEKHDLEAEIARLDEEIAIMDADREIRELKAQIAAVELVNTFNDGCQKYHINAPAGLRDIPVDPAEVQRDIEKFYSGMSEDQFKRALEYGINVIREVKAKGKSKSQQ